MINSVLNSATLLVLSSCRIYLLLTRRTLIEGRREQVRRRGATEDAIESCKQEIGVIETCIGKSCKRCYTDSCFPADIFSALPASWPVLFMSLPQPAHPPTTTTRALSTCQINGELVVVMCMFMLMFMILQIPDNSYSCNHTTTTTIQRWVLKGLNEASSATWPVHLTLLHSPAIHALHPWHGQCSLCPCHSPPTHPQQQHMHCPPVK